MQLEDDRYRYNSYRYNILLNKSFDTLLTDLEQIEFNLLDDLIGLFVTTYFIQKIIILSDIVSNILYSEKKSNASTKSHIKIIMTAIPYIVTLKKHLDIFITNLIKVAYNGIYSTLNSIYTNLYNTNLIYARFMRLFGLSPPVFLKRW